MFFLWVEVPVAPPPQNERHRRTRRRRGLHLFSADPADRDLPVPSLPRADKVSEPISPSPILRWLVLAALLIALSVYYIGLRPQFMNWGATEQEQQMALPGDSLMGDDPHYFTRAITIDAPPSVVWQWIVQMGQDRAGFYSNTWLENLTGADIHNADSLHPEWRDRHLGDHVLLARRNLFGGVFAEIAETRIVGLERERWIAFIPTRFVLQPAGKNVTRLLIRESLPPSVMARWISSFSWDPAHFVMEVRMLRGIKERAEDLPLVSPPFVLAGRIGWCLCTLGLLLAFLREHDRLLFLLPAVLWAAPVAIFTRDWDAALVAFVALAISIGGPVFFGRKWWMFFPLLSIAVALALLLSPDPYTILGMSVGGVALISRAIVF